MKKLICLARWEQIISAQHITVFIGGIANNTSVISSLDAGIYQDFHRKYKDIE